MVANAAPLPNTSTDVERSLEDAVVSGKFEVGARLPSERELCATYSVSRPVVREALRGLAARGLVSVLPGKGSFVRERQGQDLADPVSHLARQAGVTPRHVVAARANLERAAVEAAAEGATTGQLERIRAALEKHDRASGAVERARTDLAFHRAIVGASGNPVWEIMYEAIQPFTERMMLRSQGDDSVREAGDPQHRQILAAMEAGNRAEAGRLMFSHVTLAENLYGDDLDRPLEQLVEWLPA